MEYPATNVVDWLVDESVGEDSKYDVDPLEDTADVGDDWLELIELESEDAGLGVGIDGKY